MHVIFLTSLVLLFSAAQAKISEGLVTLDSDNCEQYLSKFSISHGQHGFIRGEIGVDSNKPYMDGHRHELVVAIYDDERWMQYKSMLASGSLCRERVRMANKVLNVNQVRDTDRPPGQKTRSRSKKHSFRFKDTFDPKSDAHYVYAILADCWLEEYPANPPTLTFFFEWLNGGAHLPADEDGLQEAHYFFLFVLIIFGLVFGKLLFDQYKASQKVHMLSILLGVAYILQLVAVICELQHLSQYSRDGKGLKWRHTWYAADFISEVCQESSELVIGTILVSLGMGWTLVADSRILSRVGAVALCLAAGQFILAGMGRAYEDDFNQFHDHEHLPGKLLVMLRVGLFVFFWRGVKSTGDKAMDPEVKKLLRRLTIIGSAWLLAFPLLVFSQVFVDPTWRHSAVTIGTLSVQMVALFAMMLTFLQKGSTFYKLSSLNQMGTVFSGGHNPLAAKSSKISMD